MTHNNIDVISVRRHIVKNYGDKVLFPWLLDCLMDWLIIVLTFVLAGYFNHPLGYILALFIIGNRQHALAILGHEGTHKTIHKNRKINNFCSDFLAFLPIGFNTIGYRFLHGKHHANLNTEHDPELMHRSSKAPQWDLPTTIPTILKQCFLDLFGYSFTDFLAFLILSKPDNKNIYLYMGLYHLAFLGVCIYSGWFWVAAVWYLALPTTFMMFFRLRTWIEHQGTEGTHRVKLNWFERALIAPHNIELHYEHHAYPAISYKNLPKIRALITDEPIMTLKELIQQHKNSIHVSSGQPTRPVNREIKQDGKSKHSGASESLAA